MKKKIMLKAFVLSVAMVILCSQIMVGGSDFTSESEIQIEDIGVAEEKYGVTIFEDIPDFDENLVDLGQEIEEASQEGEIFEEDLHLEEDTEKLEQTNEEEKFDDGQAVVLEESQVINNVKPSVMGTYSYVYEGNTIEYEITSDGEAVLLGIIISDMDSNVILPDSIEGYPVTEIAPDFMSNNQVTGELKLPENVRIIGDRAFFQCSNLKGFLNIPDGTLTIGNYAFYRCSGFEKKLVIPVSVEIIGDYAFYRTWFNRVENKSNTGIKVCDIGYEMWYDEKTKEQWNNDWDRNYDFYISNRTVIATEFCSRFSVDRCRGQISIGEKVETELHLYNGWDKEKLEPEENIYSYTSSNENVATVDQQGIVIGVSEGTADISVELRNGQKETETVMVYKNVSVQKGNITWHIPQKIKLGYMVHLCTAECGGVRIATVTDLPENCERISEESQFREFKSREGIFSLPHAGGRQGILSPDKKEIYVMTSYIAAIHPGKETFQLSYDGKAYGDPYIVTVEEPVIETNAPQEVTQGTTITLKASLKNTDIQDNKISDYMNDKRRSRVHTVVFQPEYEIIQGADLIDRSNGDFSNILSASENLTFKKNGTVKIKVKFNHLELCNYCKSYGTKIYGTEKSCYDYYSPEKVITIQVKEKAVQATSIKLSKTKLTLTVGQKYQLKESFLPTNVTNKKVIWTSSNNKVISVSNGKVTAKGAGTAVVTVKATDGSKKYARCQITVKVVQATSIKLSKTKLTLTVGQKYQLKESLLPTNVTNKKVTWTSSNKKVISVSNGKVTAKCAGAAVVTVKATDGSKKYARCQIMVIPAEQTLKVSQIQRTSAVQLTWKKDVSAFGYLIQYSKDPTFKKGTKSVNITNRNTFTTKIFELTKGKRYYFRVRSYNVVNGTKIYGNYTKAKKLVLSR